MKTRIISFLSLLIILLMFSPIAAAQNKNDVVAGIPVNYDEDKSGTYTLPDPLTFNNGKKVKNEKQWIKRREEIIGLFEEYQYGKTPAFNGKVKFSVYEDWTLALDGKTMRKQVTIYLTDDTSDHKIDLLVYVPVTEKPAPVFLNVSFMPNAMVVDDPAARTGYMWGRDGKKVPVVRKGGFGRMDIAQFIGAGIGFATICYGDIEPDFADGVKLGIRGHFLTEGQAYPAPDEWGAISAWAWGLGRVMDYLETDSRIDAQKVALHGISRLGKTVLWTGARDDRFGMVIASCGGEGGAALSRRNYGENIDHMTHPTRYFYQFAGNWRNFKDDPSKSPVDGHMLVALMAPRPLLLQTGNTDYWSDPKGEFLAAVAGGKVYEFLGKKSLGTETWPAAGVPILNDLGYFMHDGGHGAMPSDYPVFIEFMKKHFFK